MRDWIGRHFRRHCLRSPLQFSVQTAIEAVALGLSLAILLHFAGFDGRTDLNELDAVPLFDGIVLIAPVVETIIFQMIPIICLRWIRGSFSWQVGISTLLFWVAHAPSGFLTGLCAGLLGGFYLAFGYAVWAKRSHFTAYWTTALHHMINNAIAFGLMLTTGEIADHESWFPPILEYPLILVMCASYWVYLFRNDTAVEVRIYRQLTRTTQSILPGMSLNDARVILCEDGWTCAPAEHLPNPNCLLAFCSDWQALRSHDAIVIEFEDGFVTSVDVRQIDADTIRICPLAATSA